MFRLIIFAVFFETFCAANAQYRINVQGNGEQAVRGIGR